MADDEEDPDEVVFEFEAEAGAEDESLSEEELRYEIEDVAARKIQAIGRLWLGRRYARSYGRQCFLKEWDEERRR